MVKTEANKTNKTNTDNKEASAFTLYISIITYIINNKVIYSPRPSLKIACSFCSLVRICFVTLKQQKQQKQQAKTRQALCLIYIINYHNDLIIKYKKCTSSSLKNRCCICCFCCICCICGKCEKSTLFHVWKNCQKPLSFAPESLQMSPTYIYTTEAKTCALRRLKMKS